MRHLPRKLINKLTLLILFLMFALRFFILVPWWFYGLVVLGWFLITAFGSFFIGWNYHLKSLHRKENMDSNRVSISFDDGPHPKHTHSVLKLLEQHDAKATFFCIGQQAENHPELVKQILAEGHSIGNHTYSHSKSFGFYGKKRVKEELVRTITIVNKITGLEMKLYRPAFGVTNPQIEKAVKSLRLHSIGWSVRSLDTTWLSKDSVLTRITSKVSAGDVILLHDTSEKSVAVLEQLLVFLGQQKLKSVTVERLLDIKAYD